MIVLLLLATIVDLALAVLLIAVSGFIFGAGPKGGHGELSGVLMWSFGVLACIGLPVAGFVLRHYGKPGIGAALAWLPPLGALFIATVPAPY